MTKIVAASNAPTSWKSIADYVCTGTNDYVEIQSAFSTNDDVILSPGTFNVTGNITAGTGNITGQGPDQTILKFTNSAHLYANNTAVQTIEGFSFSGTGYTANIWHGIFTIRGPNKTMRNLVGTGDNTCQAVFLVLTDPAIANAIYNITFDNCHVADANTYAFVHSQWYYQDPPFTPVDAMSTHKNVTYINCTALRCGSATGFNAWVTGFDFAEMNHIDGLFVKNCRAEQIWESGFHFEWSPTRKNCLFEDCISKNNGQKPYKTSGFANGNPWPSHGTDYFGGGFNDVSRFDGDVTFRRCYAEGNSWFGFYGTKGAHYENCVEYHTGRTLLRDGTTRVIPSDLKGIYRPAGYRAYPSRDTSLDNTVTMHDCYSFESEGHALHFDQMDRFLLDGLTVVDPGGVYDIAVCLGCSAASVSNGNIVDMVIYSNLPKVFDSRGNINVVFNGGAVITNQTKTHTFVGSGTSGVTVKNLVTYSNATLTGTNGIVLDGTVPTGGVTISNVTQQAYASAPEKPTVFYPSTGPTLSAEQVSSTIVLTWEE